VEQPDAGAPQVVVPGQSEEAERFAQLVVRVTAGRDAEPVRSVDTVTRLSSLATP
jgi:hypothetical protein